MPSTIVVHGFQPEILGGAAGVERRALELAGPGGGVLGLVVRTEGRGHRLIQLVDRRLDAGADVQHRAEMGADQIWL